MSEEKVGIIDLGNKKEIDPSEREGYRETIARAKKQNPLDSLKGREVVGGVDRPQMPVFQTRESRASSGVEAQPQGVQPRPPGSPVLRPETQEKLAEAMRAGAEQEKSAKAGPNPDDLKVDPLALFDFMDNSNQVEKILDNKKRREEIEKRCEPMNFEDLLMRNEVRQRVPIIPGKFEPRFRSITPAESLFIKRIMAKESVNTDQYLGEKYNILLLACSLVDINGQPLPDHLNASRDVDEKVFNEKLETILHKSGYIVADLSVNYIWFDMRVRKLINPDDLKNG